MQIKVHGEGSVLLVRINVQRSQGRHQGETLEEHGTRFTFSRAPFLR